MIVNQESLLELSPIKDMEPRKINFNGVSYGLGEAGYDIRIRQTIRFRPIILRTTSFDIPQMGFQYEEGDWKFGRFSLASAMEEFQMPANLVGIVHDKSTWARQGLSVFNTVIEPGFCGGLTLELVYHGQDELVIPAGSGIAQVVFHSTSDAALYSGKYQNQSTDPVPSIFLN